MIGRHGNGEAVAVVTALQLSGYTNVYDVPVSPAVCSEPIVIEAGAWERESWQADGSRRPWQPEGSERGVRRLVAHVCREDPGDAERAARDVARALPSAGWQFESDCSVRVVQCDAGQPSFATRDSSGRWVWDVPIALTVVADHA